MSYRKIAETLGVEEPQSHMDLISLVRRGLPSSGIQSLCNKLEISPGELSRFLHVSIKTLQRYEGKILDINMSDRLLTVSLVYSKCVDVFGSEENSVAWLKSPLPSLGGACPLVYLDTIIGSEMIMTLLGRIEHCVYS